MSRKLPADPRRVLLHSGQFEAGHRGGAGRSARGWLVLAACCDMIFAAETAVFGLPEIDVGQGGGASFMQRILPPSKVRRMMLTGERVPAAEFYRLGAVEACIPDAELMQAALGIASVIAQSRPAPYGPFAPRSRRSRL